MNKTHCTDHDNTRVTSDALISAAKITSAPERRAPKDLGAVSAGRSVLSTVWFGVCCAFAVVLLGTGMNKLAIPAVGLAALTAVFFAALSIAGRKVNVWLWASYGAVFLGLFLYSLIWGADSFGYRVWWHLVLLTAPAALAAAFLLLGKVFRGNALKAAAAAVAVLMIGACAMYAVLMSLRVRPTVDRMWEGHDAYLGSLSSSSAKRNSPNVLVILMDDMGYADVSAYSSRLTDGKPQIYTPNIDSLAENGVIMENFYAASPVCSPSRFSMLTGRYNSRGWLDNVVFPTVNSPSDSTPWSPTHFINAYDFLNNVDGILGDEITFAEVLNAIGYDTYAVGKWNLGDYGEYLPTAQGFDYFYGSYYVNDMTPYTWVEDYAGGSTGGVVRTHDENLDQSMSTSLFTDKVVEKMSESAESGSSFLMYYASPWPHAPIYSDNGGGGKGDTSDDTYRDCIEEFDRGLGRILDYLKITSDEKNGGSLYDNTLIVFTSDNGPGNLGAAGYLRGRKGTPFDGGMKVPCIVSWPAGDVGALHADGKTAEIQIHGNYTEEVTDTVTASVVSARAMNFDIFTTLLSACGVTALPSDRVIDGVDLLPVLTGEAADDSVLHDVLIFLKGGTAWAAAVPVTFSGGKAHVGEGTDGEGIALSSAYPDSYEGATFTFKFFDEVPTENSAYFGAEYRNLLVNLDVDPAESYSLYNTYPEIGEAIRAVLEDFRAEMKSDRRGIR